MPPSPDGTAPNRTITAAMLAAKLGVSRSTVNIVMRGDAERRKLSPQTIEKVLAAAKQYNYIPNQIAQSLRRQRSGIVSLLVNNFRMDWCEELISGLMPVIEERGDTLFVAAHRGHLQRQEQELLAAIRRRDDAIVCQPMPEAREIYQRVVAAGIPLVFLGDHPDGLPGISRVIWNSGEAARVAVEHLIAIGRKNIAYIGNDYNLKMHLARFANYKAALKSAGLAINPDWIVQAPPDASLDEILEPALRRFFAEGRPHPDAIFMMNDGLALPTLERLDEMGVAVPEKVAVIGMGNLAMTSHRGISLSTVVEPVRELGRHAGEVCLQLMADPAAAPIVRELTSTTLMHRRTTAG